jgi:hypothetical protein
MFLKQYINIEFIIYDDLNKEYYENIFLDKYNISKKDLEHIKYIKGIKNFWEVSKNSEKVLFLDVNSFNKLESFLYTSTKIFLYCNDDYAKQTKKDIKYYGWYSEYQKWDEGRKTTLKFYFDVFKKIYKSDNKVFISTVDRSLFYNSEIISKYPNTINKEKSKHHKNLFERFNKLVYLHSTKDKNNRMIPECKYYKKEIEVIEYTNIKDSVSDRLDNPLENYVLSLDDILIKEIIEEV